MPGGQPGCWRDLFRGHFPAGSYLSFLAGVPGGEALSIFLGISFFGGDFLAIYAGVFAALHGLSLAVMSRGYSLVVLHGLLTAVASLVAEHGL